MLGQLRPALLAQSSASQARAGDAIMNAAAIANNVTRMNTTFPFLQGLSDPAGAFRRRPTALRHKHEC